MVIKYFEDIELNNRQIIGEYLVDKETLIDYAKTWDPLSFHVDEEAAQKSIYGGLIISAAQTIAISFRLFSHG